MLGTGSPSAWHLPLSRPTLTRWRPMRWTPGGVSKNIEDRRGQSGGGFGMAPMGIGGTIILLVLGLIFGVDFNGNGGAGLGLSQEDPVLQDQRTAPIQAQRTHGLG